MLILIEAWLLGHGISSSYLTFATDFVGSVSILFLCSMSFYLTRHQLLVRVEKMVKNSRNTWDNVLAENHVFIRITLLFPFLILLFLIPIFIIPDNTYYHFLQVVAKIAIIFQVARILSAFLNVVNNISKKTARDRYLPLNATIQVIKLVVYLIATILAISFVLGKSPLYLLSGLGALTAVLLLVFQDTIKGLVASIQISANRMLAPGDWIEIPQYGADGDVLEIGLNTVKVQNFDNTVTTVPTYALISGSFKNWRDMFNSGGRRIKRTIIIDVASIEFSRQDDIDKQSRINLLTQYLTEKKQVIAQHNHTLGINSDNQINQRQLTNIGTFRAYVEAYLQQHEKVNSQMTCMVRQLQATPSGLPLELYFFSVDQNWVNYEKIQADIFDHLYAMAPQFHLRIFQHPTGNDWRKRDLSD